MGFFKNLKDDLSSVMNELIGGNNTNDNEEESGFDSYFITEDKDVRKKELLKNSITLKRLEKNIPEIQDYFAMCKPVIKFPRDRCIFCGKLIYSHEDGYDPEDNGLHYFVKWEEIRCCPNCDKLVTITNKYLSDILNADSENEKIVYFDKLKNHINWMEELLKKDYESQNEKNKE